MMRSGDILALLIMGALLGALVAAVGMTMIATPNHRRWHPRCHWGATPVVITRGDGEPELVCGCPR